jgi:hypothetical protein
VIRHGKAPFSEVSSEGDKRFSAFYAKVDGRSIEEWYQAAKVFHNGMEFVTGLNWREAKGRKPVNNTEVRKLYSELWDRYIAEHPELLPVLQRMSGMQDIFGVPGHVCQATELWRIRYDSMNLKFDGSTTPTLATDRTPNR